MILQFGTSRFLQAHVDLFAWQAREAGQQVPEIKIVQVSGDGERARRLPAFADPNGFPVRIRGLENGQPIDRTTMVRSVVDGLSARSDWQELIRLFVGEATHVVSNSGDTGFDIPESDRSMGTDEAAPVSFCGILVALLHRRWVAGRPGVTFLPCELVAANGSLLRARIERLAEDRGLPPAFRVWIGTDCVWVNTLVDRIVSAPIEPAGAVAEPYALWAVERQSRLVMPFEHPAIKIVDDLAPHERLKLYILNLGHSWLAECWRTMRAAPDLTVRAAIADPMIGGELCDLYDTEVVPGFAARGMGDAAVRYIPTTLERFANPFLDHRLADIATHHAAKVDRRIGGFVRWVDEVDCTIAMPRLRAVASQSERVS